MIDGTLRKGHREATPHEIVESMAHLNRQVRAARYYVHQMRVHQYALSVLRGAMSLEEARAMYEEAMRNYDGVMANAVSGNSAEANDTEMAKGADAITERVEEQGQPLGYNAGPLVIGNG